MRISATADNVCRPFVRCLSAGRQTDTTRRKEESVAYGNFSLSYSFQALPDGGGTNFRYLSIVWFLVFEDNSASAAVAICPRIRSDRFLKFRFLLRSFPAELPAELPHGCLFDQGRGSGVGCRQTKFRRARSRLYRRQFLQANIH